MRSQLQSVTNQANGTLELPVALSLAQLALSSSSSFAALAPSTDAGRETTVLELLLKLYDRKGTAVECYKNEGYQKTMLLRVARGEIGTFGVGDRKVGRR